MHKHVSDAAFDVMVVLDQWLEDENVPHRYCSGVLEAFERLKENEYVKEAKAAMDKYCEWEFSVNMDGKIVGG